MKHVNSALSLLGEEANKMNRFLYLFPRLKVKSFIAEESKSTFLAKKLTPLVSLISLSISFERLWAFSFKSCSICFFNDEFSSCRFLTAFTGSFVLFRMSFTSNKTLLFSK